VQGIAVTLDVLSKRRKGGKEAMSREVERKDKSLRRFYSVGEVEAITSLSRATIYRKIAQGTFPVSVPIGFASWNVRL
jgi:predicted DNA-binding transcriptional regulator AlpA